MQDLRKAKYSEWLSSLFGACLISFGLGVTLAGYFDRWWPWFIITGAILHSWGMYKTHQRNK